jgi:hypothetical protein
MALNKTNSTTVNTIANRNTIQYKQNGMTVEVLDATDDVDVSKGSAVYRYSLSSNTWTLISKEFNETLKAINNIPVLVENGKAILQEIPIDNVITDVWIMNDAGDSYGKVDPDNITVIGKEVTQLDEYNGYYLRCSYNYGSVTPQLQSEFDNINSKFAIGVIS